MALNDLTSIQVSSLISSHSPHILCCHRLQFFALYFPPKSESQSGTSGRHQMGEAGRSFAVGSLIGALTRPNDRDT